MSPTVDAYCVAWWAQRSFAHVRRMSCPFISGFETNHVIWKAGSGIYYLQHPVVGNEIALILAAVYSKPWSESDGFATVSSASTERYSEGLSSYAHAVYSGAGESFLSNQMVYSRTRCPALSTGCVEGPSATSHASRQHGIRSTEIGRAHV